LVGGRDAEYALALMDDLRSRMQLTTDGHAAYLSAVEVAVCWAATVRRDLTLPFIIDRIA
jgi:hypothetical protein